MAESERTTQAERPSETAENWRKVPGFSSYEVSDMGRIRVLAKTIVCLGRCGNPVTKRMRSRVLKGWITRDSRAKPRCITVGLVSDGGVKVKQKLHRLVLLAFIGPAPDGTECCHGDGDFRNNQLDNLRWDTHSSNMADCVKHGTWRTTPQLGEKHYGVKLSDDDISRIIAVPRLRGVVTDLAHRYGVSSKTISAIRNGTYARLLRKLKWEWRNAQD